MSSLLEELGYIEEEGSIDSSLFDLMELIFCNIPGYLDNTNNNNYFDSIKNYYYIDGNPIDGSAIYDKSDDIVDSILSGDFFDFTINGIENLNTSNPLDVIRGQGVTVDQHNTHIPGYEPDGYGKPIDYTYDRETETNKNTTEINIPSDSSNDVPFTGFGKSAIVEFAADTVKWPYEPYVLFVAPGDHINSDTIIGKCLQEGEMKPIRSIFSKGVVRVDPSDGGFGMCAKTICHNHIIIDGYEIAREKSWDGSDVRYLMKNPLMIHDYQVHQEEAMDAFYLVTEILPYLLYLNLIIEKSKSSLHKIPFKSLGYKDLLKLGSKAKNQSYVKSHYRTQEPEDEFNKFINGVYIPRKQQFLEDIKKHYGGDNYTEHIKDTKGNIKKMIEFGEEMIRLKNEFYDDIVKMCKEPGFDDVDILPDHEESSKIEYDNYPYCLSRKEFDFVFEEIIKGEGETKGEQYENGSLNQYEPVEEDETFSEYFRNIARMIRGENEDKDTVPFSMELKTMLLEFAESHPTSGDARGNIQEELARLNAFKDKIMSIYELYKIVLIDKDEDRVLKEMFDLMPDEARWPLPSDYEYRGEFFRKWTFPNIDAMTPKKPYDDNLNPINPVNHDYAPNGYKEVTMDDIPPREYPDPGDVSALFMSERSPLPFTEADPRTNEKPGNIELGDINYWRKYLAIATIVTLPFLATGFYMVPGEYIQLPCIYIPLKVVNISKVGLIIVIGLAIRGVSINILLIYVNMAKDANTVLLPVTILLSDLKEIYYDDIKALSNMIPVIANGMLNTFKTNSVAMLKENKRYLAEMTGLDALQLPSKTDLEKSAKESFGEDTRQIVIRLEEDAKRYKDKWNNLEEAYTDFETGFRDLVKKDEPNNT